LIVPTSRQQENAPSNSFTPTTSSYGSLIVVLRCSKPIAHLPRQEVRAMEDLKATREKLLLDAMDCELIARLATNKNKRDLFHKLATDLRSMAADIEAAITHGATKDMTKDMG
jgi:hypothetical protein